MKKLSVNHEVRLKALLRAFNRAEAPVVITSLKGTPTKFKNMLKDRVPITSLEGTTA